MVQNYNGLPLYEATLNMMDDELGMFVISLVDAPAVERDFVAFNEEKRVLTYSVANEEQQKVFGLIMECDKPIYRRTENNFEYYITYNRKTIEIMAEKYFKMGYQNNVDTMHNFELEEGITLTQMFIKDSEKGVNPIGFEDVNNGSLFAEFHIENTEIWNAIKEGTYKGFSLAGCFEVNAVEQFNKEEYKENKLKMKVNKMKEMLRKLLAEFGEVATDKGTLVWDGDEDLKAGDAVHSVDAEGKDVAVEDGDYRTEDKKIIKVADGKVVEIVDDEAEIAPMEGEEIIEEPKEVEEDEKDVRIKELEAELEKAKEEADALRAELDDAKAKIAELENESIGESAEEKFAKMENTDNSPKGKMAKRGYKL